jgi:hypothetical protein
MRFLSQTNMDIPFDWKLLAESIAIGIIDGKLLRLVVCGARVEETAAEVGTKLFIGLFVTPGNCDV